MPAKRRLEDLYVIGKELNFDDGGGEVRVWLQKLNPIETGGAIRRANAARARIRSVKADKTSDEYMDIWLEVLDWDTTEALVAYLAAEEVMRIQARNEAELAGEEEWSKDSYLQGLQDAWNDGLSELFFTEPDNPEARRVKAELERFAEAASKRGEREIEQTKADLAAKPVSVLQEMTLDKIIEYRSGAAWMDEFHRCELFYGVRDPDNHKVRYFAKREQVDELSGPVLSRLLDEYAVLSVAVDEGKDLAGNPPSSPSSELPSEPETDDSSGLAIASR
jgi:hypothetical protein